MLKLAITAAALALAGQASDQPLTPGTVSVELTGDHAAQDQPFADAVTDALQDAGFLPLPGRGHGRYIAEVSVTHQARGVVATHSAAGDATAGGGSIGVPFGAAGPAMHGLVLTRLTVALTLRDGMRTVWRGSAATATVENGGSAEAKVAAKLARAVIGHFPEQSSETIAVP